MNSEQRKNVSQIQQSKIKQIIKRANKAVKRGNIAVALQLYSTVLQYQPNHSSAKKAVKELQNKFPGNHSIQNLIANPTREQINSLINMYQTGQMRKTEQYCNELLKTYPQSLVVINVLGAALHGQGKLDGAAQAFERIIQLKPDDAEAYNNRCVVLKELGQLSEAVTSCEMAINIKPDYAEAYNNQGVVFNECEQFEEALESFNKAIKLKPDYAEAYNNRGVALYGLGQQQMALESYDQAINIRSDYAGAYSNRGNVLKKLGQPMQALTSYEKVIAIKPNDAEAFYKRAVTLCELGQFKEAVESFTKVIELKPEDPVVYRSCGNALRELGKLKEAVKSYDIAIELKSDHAKTHNNRGTVLRQLGEINAALKSYDMAIDIKPDFAMAYSNRGNVLGDMGQLKESVDSYNKAIEIDPDYAEAYSNRNLQLNYFSDLTKDEVFKTHLEFEKRFGCKVNESPRMFQNRDTNLRLRVGYLSPDFRTHSVGYFFETLLRSHNKNIVEVYCYYNNTIEDDTTRIFMDNTEHWRSIVKMNDESAFDLIRKDNIDILIDLAGHTAGNRLTLFAFKPAPVQLTWLGYPNTTGLSAIDYRFTDEVADPIGESDELHSEKLVRLPNGFLCYQIDDSVQLNKSLPCLDKGYFTFGSFNNLTKVTEQVVKLWSRILQEVPNSRLLLKAKQLGDTAIKTNILHLFEQEGISVDRIELVSQLLEQQDHMKLYNTVDIALDPFPYNGTTTTCESIWMGVPVITMLGDRHAGRVGASILTQVGIKNFIAKNINEYVSMADSYANKIDYLVELRNSLRDKMIKSPLCDAVAFSRSVENEYYKMWNEYKGIS